jgi:hypothetical protein
MIAELPAGALLQRYRDQGVYTDSFAIDVPGQVALAAYVEAFYTIAVFKLERLLLALFVARPSRDAEAGELASGQRQQFAAWSVEGGGARPVADVRLRRQHAFLADGRAHRAGHAAVFRLRSRPLAPGRHVPRAAWLPQAVLVHPAARRRFPRA